MCEKSLCLAMKPAVELEQTGWVAFCSFHLRLLCRNARLFMQEKDKEIGSLNQQLADKEGELEALEASKVETLKKNKEEHTVALRRHLELIDRLLIDKGGLSKKVLSLTEVCANI